MLLFRYFYMFYVLDFCDVKFLKIYCFKFFGCVLKYDKLEGGGYWDFFMVLNV